MTSGRTSKLIRELDRTLVFGEYVSSKRSDEPTAPMIYACTKFRSDRLLDELLQRKTNDRAKRDLMEWSNHEG